MKSDVKTYYIEIITIKKAQNIKTNKNYELDYH